MLTRDIEFRVDSLKLVGELYLPEGRSPAKLPALCLCHGIPAQRPVPGDQGYPSLARGFTALGIVTMIFNFRGCGLSEGNLDMLGWTRDLSGAIDYLAAIPEVDRDRLLLMGFSGGAAAAVYVTAADPRVKGLVGCACPARFTMVQTREGREAFLKQAREMGTIKDPGFPASEKEWAANFGKISPVKFISYISPRPLLLIHGDADDVVPVSHARRLYRRAGEPKELAVIPGAGHRLRLEERAMDLARNWVQARLEGF
ncbi:MAG: alpha/beta fold hydrolase [Chloroflexi bacterium]|nr:alpha/beta fold hydrolase [Chloroflexota bacterium]